MGNSEDWSDIYKETGELPDPFEEPPDEWVEPSELGNGKPNKKKEPTAKHIKPVIKSALESIEERLKRGGKLAGESLGITLVDKSFDGWQRGRFYVVAGRTGMGKSIVGQNFGSNAASSGLAVDYLSLEMPIEELALRSLFCQSRVSSDRMRNGTMQPEDWSKMIKSVNDMGKWPFWWDDSSGVTVEWIREQIQETKQIMKDEMGKELFLVVIDHIQKINGTNARVDRRQQMVHITDQLKVIAKEENVCMLGLAQINREPENRGKDKRPRISDLQESGSIEQEADGIILLFREDYYRKKADWDFKMDMAIPKIRGGEPTLVKVRFTGDQYRIDNLAEDEWDDAA